MFVLHNPHSFDMIFRPLSYFLVKKRAHLKYSHLLDLLFKNSDILVTIDYSESSLITSRKFVRLPFFLRYIIVSLEVFIWARLNGISHKVRFVKYDKGLKGLILISFSYKSCVYLTKEKEKVFDQVRGISFHLSHYMIQTNNKSKVINKYKGKAVVMADVDISLNPYYRKYFDNDLLIFVVPFQVSNRFVVQEEFPSRSKQLLVSGTVHDLTLEEPESYYTDFMQFFKNTAYHEIRGFFLKENFDCVDNRISPFRSDGNSLQSSYFKIDLVDLLNQYQYVCYDRELSGAPAITTFESIACGCIPIVHSGSLSGLDLDGKFDYIEFGESLSDFKNFIINKYPIMINSESINEQKNTNIADHMLNIAKKNLGLIESHFLDCEIN